MNILMTMRHSKNEYSSWIDVLENDYVNYFESFGVNVIPVPNSTSRLDDYFAKFSISGIVFTGGECINCGVFNHVKTGKKDVQPYARDLLEIDLMEKALNVDLPVFGICRGMQFINLFFGGSLQPVKDLETKKPHALDKRHSIQVADNDLEALLGTDRYVVNSYHEQAIVETKLPKTLEVFAVSEGVRIVEGIRAKSSPVAGIQWHPERSLAKNSINNHLVSAFLNRELFWKQGKS